MGKLPFDIHALGSPTEVMERYRFDVLVDMIMAAKMNLPVQRPLHLFGAGHPFMFTLAVALGCDLFDSAAYALYAKEGRYMTETGTSRLDELDYFPCTCPRCSSTTPRDLRAMPLDVVCSFLAEHNLYVSMFELKRIKQAIKDGRLWEHLQMQSHSHPSLLEALRKLKTYKDFIEKHDVVVKNSGLFCFDSTDLMRPEVVRHEKKLAARYVPPKSQILLLAPQTRTKPFHKSREFKQMTRCLGEKSEDLLDRVHVCFYAAPFGIIPYELDEVYPLSQHETVSSPDSEAVGYVTDQIIKHIFRTDCKLVVLLDDPENWGDMVRKKVKKTCSKRNVMFRCVTVSGKQPNKISRRLGSILSSE
jgi:7-cyano-7-deazaguanine tRNA-ribosyltransferase